MTSLLDKAKTRGKHLKIIDMLYELHSREELMELLIAFFSGEITSMQLSDALGKKRKSAGTAIYAMMMLLRDEITKGNYKITKVKE